jgi:transcription initiation factor TFIIIB Brf1 subunit/transcription initiation factor TFIIB
LGGPLVLEDGRLQCRMCGAIVEDLRLDMRAAWREPQPPAPERSFLRRLFG